MKYINLGLARMSADTLLTFGREVRDKVTASADVFPNPLVPMATLATNITNLQLAQQATLSGWRSATIHRNEMRKIVESDLTLTAQYVSGIANGNPDIIILAGMLPRKKGPRRYDSLTTPLDLRLKNGLGGEVILRWKKVAHAKNYAVEYCMDPITPDGWRNGTYNTYTTATVGGLEVGKRYWFRVRAMGSNSIVSDWSDPAMIVVV